MTKRLYQLFVALLVGTLFFGVSSLNAKPVYATNTTVKVYKFNDLNYDGDKDSDESYLRSWTFTAKFISDPCIGPNNPSGCGGTYTDKGPTTIPSYQDYISWSLHRGNWKICEVIQNGWLPTGTTDAQGCQTIYVPYPSAVQQIKFGNVQDINPSCATLNANNGTYPSIKSDYGFKINSVPVQGNTYYFTAAYGALTGGAPSDSSNSVTFPSVNNPYFTWAASMGIDAVIVKGGPNASVYVYNPESMGAGPLNPPINPSNGNPYGISHVEFCYDYEPQVSKTAVATYDETTTWDIDKTVDPTLQSGFAGDTLSYKWTVTLGEETVAGNYAISGQITVKNQDASQSVSGTLSDVLDDGTPVTINGCSGDGVTYDAGTLTIAGGKTATCSYTASPTNTAATKNTATFTSGGKEYKGEATFTWTKNVINGMVTVDDDQNPNDFPVYVSAGDNGPRHWEYTEDYLCSTDKNAYNAQGTYQFKEDNTAEVKRDTTVLDSASASTAIDCYIPSITKTADGTYDERHEWDVEKTVDPALQSAFAGDTVNFDWTITVDETVYEENFDVAGQIVVSNPNPDKPMTVAIEDSIGGNAVTITSCTGDTNLADGLTVAAGGSSTCDYTAANLPFSDIAQAPTENTAKITLNTIEFSASDTIEWIVNEIREEATLDDDQKPYAGVPVYDGWSSTYEDSYTCSTTLADYTTGKDLNNQVVNTAEVYADQALQDSSTATTVIDCYIPSIEKTAAGTYDERHEWDVEKTVSPLQQSAFAGDTVDFDWTITVNETVVEENFDVAGTITVGNPNPEDALTVTLADVLSDGTAVTIASCSGDADLSNGLTVAAGGSSTCDYTANNLGYQQVGDAPTANTATVTRNQIAFSGSDPIEWVVNKIRETATLDDDQKPYNGQSVSDGWSATYSDSYVCSTTLEDYSAGKDLNNQVVNTAEVFSDQALQDSSTATTVIDCYIPSITKTAAGSHTLGHKWEIEKTVSPLQQSAFAGNSVSFDWTVTLVETESAESFEVAGTVTAANPNPEDALVVTLADTLDDNTPVVFGACVGGALASDQLTVPAGGTAVCDYSASPTDATATKNTATISLNQIVFTAVATVGWTVQDLGLAEVTVDDDQYASFPQLVSAGDTWTYPDSYTCSSDVALYAGDGVYEYTENNLAVVRNGETILDQDDADALVKCYAPVASKTAQAEWQREYTWEITKSVEPAAHAGFPGDTFESLYTVAVERTVTDSGFKASGTIAVVNPAGSPGDMLVDVSDKVGGAAATVDCGGGATSLTVPTGEIKTCSYQMALPDATDRTNTATVAFNQINFTASAAVDFGDPIVKGFATINVKDFFNGDPAGEALGSASGDKSFTYTRPFECPVESGEYTDGFYEAGFPNVAKIVETNQQDDANVTVNCELLAGLGDRVWFDANQNGQQDNNEVGIAGVKVELLQNGSVIATKNTDASGNYSFTGLQPGTYSVRFPTTGLTAANQGNDASDSDADPATGTTTTTLDAGEYDPTLDAGYLPAALGDRIWTDSNKNGLQDAGEQGIGGVAVELLQGGNVIATTTTDANGNYAFTGLKAGSYVVRFPTLNLTDPNTGDPAADSNPDKTAGETSKTLNWGEVDNTLDAGYIPVIVLPSRLGDFVWEDHNANGKQDNSDSGVAGVTVNLLQGGSIIKTTVTGQDGKYLFDNLTPGQYAVCFVLPDGYAFTTPNASGVADVLDSDAGEGGCTGPIDLAVNEDDRSWDAGLVKTTPAPASLGDFVWKDKNEDGIQNDTDSGVGGVTVTLKQGGNVIRTTTTSNTGFYLFDNLEAGEYVVCFEKPEDFDFTDLNTGANDGVDSDAATDGCTTTITLTTGQTDLTWDAGLVDTTPTNEDEENQPGRSVIFLPSLQTSTDGAAVQATVASVNPQDMQQEMYLPTLQGD
jgi:hypothetical protein